MRRESAESLSAPTSDHFSTSKSSIHFAPSNFHIQKIDSRFHSFVVTPHYRGFDSGCTNHAAEAALELKVIVLAIGYTTQVSRAIYCFI